MTSQLHRVAETSRPAVEILVDGEPVTALAGDTVLTAMLLQGKRLRVSEFGDGPRAGFCLMGACQDCRVRTAGGGTIRACSTEVRAGMDLRTDAMGPAWIG